MLCPSCGAEVGDEIRLCDSCKEERERRKREAEMGAAAQARPPIAGEADEVSAEPDAVEEEPEEEEAPSRFWLKVLLASAGVLVLVVFFIILSLSKPQPTTPAAVSSTTLPAPSQDLFIPVAGGTLQVADETVKLTAGAARYNPLRQTLQSFLFDREPSPAIREAIRNGEDLRDIQHDGTMLVFSLRLPPGVACELSSTDRLQVYINRTEGDYQFTEEFSFAPTAVMVPQLQCEIGEGKPFQAMFQHNTERVAGGVTMPLRWEVELSSKLSVAQSAARISFDSTSAVEQLALLNRDAAVLEIGLFMQELSPVQREQLRLRKSLFAAEGVTPAVFVSLDLQENVKELELAALRKYGVTFVANEQAGFRFPPGQDRVSFYYVPPPAPNTQLSALSGGLFDGERAHAQLEHTAKKEVEGLTLSFDWRLVLSAPIYDVSSERKEQPVQSTPGAEGAKVSVPTPDAANRAQITVAESSFTFTEAHALYYPEEGDVAIGFYNERLTDAERAEIKRKRSIWSYVNNKRPNFVIFLDFKRDATEATNATLLGYTVSFLRDKVGGVYFSGPRDTVRIERNTPEPLEGEVREAQGTLQDGSQIRFKIRSEHTGKTSGIRYLWDAQGSVKIDSVR